MRSKLRCPGASNDTWVRNDVLPLEKVWRWVQIYNRPPWSAMNKAASTEMSTSGASTSCRRHQHRVQLVITQLDRVALGAARQAGLGDDLVRMLGPEPVARELAYAEKIHGLCNPSGAVLYGGILNA